VAGAHLAAWRQQGRDGSGVPASSQVSAGPSSMRRRHGSCSKRHSSEGIAGRVLSLAMSRVARPKPKMCTWRAVAQGLAAQTGVLQSCRGTVPVGPAFATTVVEVFTGEETMAVPKEIRPVLLGRRRGIPTRIGSCWLRCWVTHAPGCKLSFKPTRAQPVARRLVLIDVGKRSGRSPAIESAVHSPAHAFEMLSDRAASCTERCKPRSSTDAESRRCGQVIPGVTEGLPIADPTHPGAQGCRSNSRGVPHAG